jgi:hypothetical protein
MPNFPSILQTPPGPEASAADFVNYVSLGVVGHDPEDPSLAFVRVVNGQVLVEVELSGDGDEVDAYLCHSQTGADAGDYIPVAAGDCVVLVWPDGQSASPYIIARLADVERQLAGSCCGIDTSGEQDRVRQFRWLRTPEGQIYAVQSGGELLLQGGGNGVRIAGEQVLLTGAVHIGADFTVPPTPGEVISGEDSTPTVPGAPFIPEPGVSLAEEPIPGQLAAGIVRFKDSIESNLATDPDFWSFILTVNGLLSLTAAFLAVPWPYDDPETLPKSIKPQHTTASTTHTCNDPPA